ncbi:hypothetical protein EU527_12765 [Candidatus Thorarchaeota archaeon]|nr:MAG: hypothetical protein EU527_12765 [Candidatus Thorarchaeota archaeon]
MSDKGLMERDALLRALQDILGEMADKIDELPEKCQICPPMKILSEFAIRLRKAGLQEEAEIIKNVRDFYNI